MEEEYIDLFRVEVEEDIVNLSFDLPVTNTLKIICCLLKNLRSSNTITLPKNVSMEIKHFFYPIKKKAKNFLVVQEEKDQLEKCQRSRRWQRHSGHDKLYIWDKEKSFTSKKRSITICHQFHWVCVTHVGAMRKTNKNKLL